MGEDFEQHGMLDAAVDDMGLLCATAQSIDAAFHLRDHAAVDDALANQGVGLVGVERRDDLAVGPFDPGDIGQQDELLGVQGLGDLAGDGVGVDVVGLALFADPDGCDDRNEVAAVERLDHRWVHGAHLPDHADIHLVMLAAVLGDDGQLAGEDQIAVLARQPHCFAAVAADQGDDLLVDLAEDHLDDVHGRLIGDAHAAHELRFDVESLQQIVDLGAAAVDDHRIDADELQQHDVLCEALLELLVDHCVATVLDDHRLA